MGIEWQNYRVDGEFPKIKNKIVRAIYVDKNNADKLSEETQVFEKINDNCISTGFLSIQRIPVWIVNINPNARVKRYVLENERVFEKHFILVEENK